MDDTPSIAQTLHALSRSTTARTQMARLRELLPDIERAQATGVKHQHILEALNIHGFSLSMKSYSVMLFRLRQARAKSAGARVPSGVPQSPAQTPVALALNARGSGAASTTPAAGPTSKPGAPQRFDWDHLKNNQPEW